MFKALFRVAKPSRTTKTIIFIIIIIIIIKESTGSRESFFNKIPSFKHQFLFKIFTLGMIFLGMVTSLCSSSAHHIDNIVRKKKSSQKWKFWLKVYV